MLDPHSPVPLYHQLKIALRKAIDSGAWAPDQAMPTERELTEQYGVSRITVRQALADLTAEGLVYRRHGKGTFVAQRRTSLIAESLTELTGHLEELQLRGLGPAIEVLELDVRPLPEDVATALQRPAGSEGWYMHRKVSVDGLPLMLTEVYLPRDVGLGLDADAVRHTGINPLLEAAGYVPAKGNQRIGAQTADSVQARLLGIKKGEALLKVVRVISGTGDQPLVWFRTLYRADRYEYEVELKRRR